MHHEATHLIPATTTGADLMPTEPNPSTSTAPIQQQIQQQSQTGGKSIIIVFFFFPKSIISRIFLEHKHYMYIFKNIRLVLPDFFFFFREIYFVYKIFWNLFSQLLIYTK